MRFTPIEVAKTYIKATPEKKYCRGLKMMLCLRESGEDGSKNDADHFVIGLNADGNRNGMVIHSKLTGILGFYSLVTSH